MTILSSSSTCTNDGKSPINIALNLLPSVINDKELRKYITDYVTFPSYPFIAILDSNSNCSFDCRLYPVDKARVNEYGQSFDEDKDASADPSETKKTK